jgi:hypothetical protein
MIQYDACDATLVPSDPGGAYAGYINGNWQSYWPLCQRFPGRPVLPISVWLISAEQLADLALPQICWDIEQGDLTAAQAPAAVQASHQAGHPLPVLYGSQDTLNDVLEQLAAAGIQPGRDCLLWLARPDNDPTVPAGYAAVQFQWTENWDASAIADPRFYGAQQPAPPAPPAPTPEDAMSIAIATNHDGRLEAFVHLQDGTVAHTWQVAPGQHWDGEDPQDPGKHAAWHPLGAPGK